MPFQTDKKVYVKDNSNDPIFKTVNYQFYFKSRILSGLLMSLGFFVLGTQVAVPLIFFKTQDSVIKPARDSVLGLATGYSEFEFKELKDGSMELKKSEQKTVPETFNLSIPKLGIVNAVVETNSTNLSPEESLGHYSGSALPAEVGNMFIYGHSVLPWFYNPKNYRTIFSTLGNLATGDSVEVSYNNKKYVYKVESKEILPPDKVHPLSGFKPAYLNEKTMTLMTCWPAGTKTNRLLVKAVMEAEKN